MKKVILTILTACALMSTVHAQTVVVHRHRPGLFSGLVDTAEALLLLPLAVAEGVVAGTAEVADAVLNGSTTIYTAPAPVYVAPAPVVVTPAPVVVAPATVQTTVTRTRTVSTSTTTTTTVTRPAYDVVVPRRVVRYW